MVRLQLPVVHLRLTVAIAVFFAAVGFCPATAFEGDKAEADVLLAFRDKLRTLDGSPPAKLRAWGTTGPCRGNTMLWVGVTCHINGSVHGLHLRGLGLSGAAPDLGPLDVLPSLRVINLSDNDLAGEFPDVSSLVRLKVLLLSQNRLTGMIPDDAFANLRGLWKLHLGSNDFWGPVPGSIASSPRLEELTLENNHFDGVLPNFTQKEPRVVDFSNNNLYGPIPDGLTRFNASAFQGNKFLCGRPLDVTCESLSSPSGTSDILVVAAVLLGIGALLAIAVIALGILGRRRRRRWRTRKLSARFSRGDRTPSQTKLRAALAANTAGQGAPSTKCWPRRDEHARLVFVQEGRKRFEMEDLLQASAEVLEAGTFGSSYKATVLDGGPTMVVKRFKDMNGVGRDDFAEHMRRLGRLSHPNLLPLVAYLYKKDEKLLITEHVPNGSLARLLHGNQGVTLEWGERLRIIKGAARALAYLHDELPTLTLPHGHLKSANVLINGDLEAVLSDYALVPLLPPAYAAQVMVAYRAPECAAAAQQGKPSRKSDVWSLGALILEALTGKFPANYPANELAGWAGSAVKEDRAAEVLDKGMAGASKGCEGEMVKLLKVGLACREADIERRLDVKTAVACVEEIKEPLDGDSSLLSEGFVDLRDIVVLVMEFLVETMNKRLQRNSPTQARPQATS